MKVQWNFDTVLNIIMVIALVTLTIVWIRTTKKPGNLEDLIENENSYVALINEDALEHYKHHVESVHPQYNREGKAYYAHVLASVKVLDSAHARIQQAASFGNREDSVLNQLTGIEKLLDNLFADYLKLRKTFEPDTLNGTSHDRRGSIQYYEEISEGKKLFNDFKNNLATHPWNRVPPELQTLMLHDLENQYFEFIVSFDTYPYSFIYLSDDREVSKTKLPKGTLKFTPPKEMVLYEKKRIQVQISKRQQQEFMAKAKAEGNIIDSVTVSDIMTVKLMGEDFEIIPLDDEEQGVTEQGYTQWEFDITPKESGTLDLYVKAGIVYAVPGLGLTKKSFPVYERRIEVHASPVKRFASFMTERWEFLITTFLIPALSWGYSRIRRSLVKNTNEAK
jgi:hypothetical protein